MASEISNNAVATATPPETDVSSNFPYTLHRTQVLGLEMAYVDTRPEEIGGSQPTALFLHGNPTSSYIWRNIIPHVSSLIRCVAPDLIGMGESSKPEDLAYRFTDHYTFLSAFIKKTIPTGPVLLVVQDWGSGLGFHWAYQQAEANAPATSRRVLGLAFMEFVRLFPSYGDLSEDQKVTDMFTAFRDPVQGRKMLIEDNLFIEQVLPVGVVRKLAPSEMDYYRRPYKEPSAREPLYVWPNQIPIEGKPSDVYDIATRYNDWLLECDIPKLMFWATPGMIVTADKAKWYQQHMKHTEFVHLGQGLHFLQEDHPRTIGEGIAEWAGRILSKER